MTDDALIAFGLTENWLQQVRPAIEADARTHEFIPSVLVHGDLKGANLGLRPFGDSAVVDWSGAHLGDPNQDRVELGLFARMAGVRDPRTPTPEQRSLLAVLCGLLLEEAIASASWTIAHAREASRIKRATARAALEWYGG